jgi:hypothetical protein
MGKVIQCFLATGTLCSEAMSLPTEVLRHAMLFASRLVVVHARFPQFCGSGFLLASGLSFGTAKREDLSRPAEAPAIPGDIIPEWWATSSRNGGRHYLGMGGRHHSGIMGGTSEPLKSGRSAGFSTALKCSSTVAVGFHARTAS